MANTVCLSANQQKFYNYIMKFYKDNGYFPNPSRAGRDMKWRDTTIKALYGVLFLKGAFTNGQVMIDGYAARHNSTKVQALNVAEIKVKVPPRVNAHKAQKSKQIQNQQQIAQALIKLLSGGDNSAILSQLVGQLGT